MNPRQIGSDESPCSCCPARKMGFVHPWRSTSWHCVTVMEGKQFHRHTLVSQPAVLYYVGISLNNRLVCVRFVWFWSFCGLCTLLFQTAQEGVIMVFLNRFIRHLVPLRFISIQYLALLWRFMFGYLDRICVEVVYGVHYVIRTSTQPFNVIQRLVLVMYTSR